MSANGDEQRQAKRRRLREMAICPVCMSAEKVSGRVMCRDCWAMVAWPQRLRLADAGTALKVWDEEYRLALETVLRERRRPSGKRE